jgi:hypothetical protein
MSQIFELAEIYEEERVNQDRSTHPTPTLAHQLPITHQQYG